MTPDAHLGQNHDPSRETIDDWSLNLFPTCLLLEQLMNSLVATFSPKLFALVARLSSIQNVHLTQMHKQLSFSTTGW